MFTNLETNDRRNETGSLGATLLSALVLIVVGLGALAVDCSHMLTVRSELQNGADAASLAGAHDLLNEQGDADVHALQMAAANKADGRAISNDTPDTQVDVQVIPSASVENPGTVQVDANMTIKHLLAPIFGRNTDEIIVRSKAAAYPTTVVLAPNQAFPIAVSIDQWPNGPGNPADKPLKQLHIGDDIKLIVRPSGTPGRNAVWTPFFISSANTNTYVALIEQNLGLRPPDPDLNIPALEAGVSVIHLDNGLNRGTDINTTYEAPIAAKPFLTVPVITGDQYNQSQVVRGFITVKVNSVELTSGEFIIQGKLVKGIVRGWSGSLPSSGDPDIDNAMGRVSSGIVKLISAYSD